MTIVRKCCALLLLSAFLLPSVATGQQVAYIDNSDPTSGTSNAFPWNRTAGFTALNVYSAADIMAAGITPGTLLTDIAVAPSSSSGGVYSAPQVRFVVGHAPNGAVAGNWETNIPLPFVIHDLTDGPYSFPYILDTWSSLPGVFNAGFVWNGVDDLAMYITISPGVSGGFNAHRTSNSLRHVVSAFQPTIGQNPSSTGNAAMKVRLTFQACGLEYQVNTAQAALDADGITTMPCVPGVARLTTGAPVNINLNSALFGQGWELAFTTPEPMIGLSGGATIIPGTSEFLNLDLSAPSFTALNNFTFPAFGGNLSFPFSSPTPLTIAAQMAVSNPAVAPGFSLSGPIQVEVL